MKKRSFVVLAVLAGVALVAVLMAARYGPLKDTARNMLRGSVRPDQVNTGIPIISITTDGRVPVTSKEVFLNGTIEIRVPLAANPASGEYDTYIEDTIEIRGRGNTTWTHPQKPYRIRFPQATALFGFEEARNWVLLANYQDTSLIMNGIAFELGLRLGIPFPHHYQHVDLILNGVYQGSYVLTEHNQIGKGRVDIDEDTGFFVELDRYYDEEPKFQTELTKLPVMIKSPSKSYQFVKDAVNELEAALFAEDFPQNKYRDLVDIAVLIDFLLINEVVRNVDLQLPGSIYMYRDGTADAKIGFSPLWDFDYGFGGAGHYYEDYSGMFYNTLFFGKMSGQQFFARFFEDPAFRTQYKQRWNEIYAVLVDMGLFIDTLSATLEKSHETNFKVWWWNAVDYQEEIGKMHEWWNNRIAYLNKEINEQF
ncbi:CotH kinase family protein [Breznakiellaceae bacterium SP9]